MPYFQCFCKLRLGCINVVCNNGWDCHPELFTIPCNSRTLVSVLINYLSGWEMGFCLKRQAVIGDAKYKTHRLFQIKDICPENKHLQYSVWTQQLVHSKKKISSKSRYGNNLPIDWSLSTCVNDILIFIFEGNFLKYNLKY